MQFESNTPSNLHQQLTLLRGDSNVSDAFNRSQSQVPFDFPEVELAGCDSMAISLGFGFGSDSAIFGNHPAEAEKEQIPEVEDLLHDVDVDSCKAILDSSFGSLAEEEEAKPEVKQPVQDVQILDGVTDEVKKGISKKAQAKKRKDRKRRKCKQKEKKVRRERRVTMQKSANNIMQSLAIDMDGIFQLYPTLKQKQCEEKMHKISTFPSVFGNTENFCIPPQKSKKGKRKHRSQKTKSTLDCDLETLCQKFGEVKSTLVRSKVNNLKGSMLCFEMTNNLREMVQISKCVKWQRRLNYRKQLAERDSGSSSEEGSSSDENSCL